MFSLVHLHLAINHSPLYTETFAFFFLLIGVIRKNRTLVTSGLVIAIIAAFCAMAADFTGNGAADFVQHSNPPLAGVDTHAIDPHDAAATWALISTGATGVFAIFILWWDRKRDPKRWMKIVTLVLMAWSISVILRVATLGGRIHHQEVRAVVQG